MSVNDTAIEQTPDERLKTATNAFANRLAARSRNASSGVLEVNGVQLLIQQSLLLIHLEVLVAILAESGAIEIAEMTLRFAAAVERELASLEAPVLVQPRRS